MQAFFHFLATNPYILLFFTVGLSVWIGRQTIAGYGLGMVAAAIVVGCGLSVWGCNGEKLELNDSRCSSITCSCMASGCASGRPSSTVSAATASSSPSWRS